MTRLSSSSPVAATTTSALAKPAASRADTSQASLTIHWTPRRGPSGGNIGVDLDEQDFVAGLVEVGGQVAADVAGAGDHDLHDRGLHDLAFTSSGAFPGAAPAHRAPLLGHRDVQDVPFLADGPGLGQEGPAAAGERT